MRQNPLAYLAVELDSLKSQGLCRKLRVLEGEQRPTPTVDHRQVVDTIAGTMAIHIEREERLADFTAVVFQSGFTATAGTVSSVLTKDDVVICAALDTFSRVGTELGIIP